MNAKGQFISLLFVVNSFFGGYAAGLNSRFVEVVDPALPPWSPPKTAAEPDKSAKVEAGKAQKPGDKTAQKPVDKTAGKGKHREKSSKASDRKQAASKSENSKDKKHQVKSKAEDSGK
jgi:hypothetical protein